MEGINLWCETPNCENPAVVFGMKGNQKTKSCETHIPQLLTKKSQIFDIAGFRFISSPQDAALLEERRDLVQKGLGNLTALEASCEFELTAALASIEKVQIKVLKDVESRFAEMKLAVAEVCTETKTQISQLKKSLERFLLLKENQLSPSDLLICSDLKVAPKFLRFGIADASEEVSAMLSDCWAIAKPDIDSTLKCLDESQKSATIESILKEAAEYARKGIIEALQYGDSLFGAEESFEEGSGNVISELLEFEKKRIERNLKWLQSAWDLRQRQRCNDLATAEVGQHLAVLLSRQLGKFSEAEQILQLCYNMRLEDPLSEGSMSLCNAMCEVYLNSKQTERAKELCLWILNAFESEELPPEHYFITLFYLFFSKIELKSELKYVEIIENWLNRGLRVKSKLAEMLHLYLSTIVSAHHNKVAEAVRIGRRNFPTSWFTALLEFAFAANCSDERKMLYSQHSKSTFEVVAPTTFFASLNNFFLGSFLKEENRLAESEECYRQALAINEVIFPKSEKAANMFFNVVKLFETMKRATQALQFDEKTTSTSSESGTDGEKSTAERESDKPAS